jgi:hypothetical protein
MATRTCGSLGHNDAGSPDSTLWFLGDTPGSLGVNDHADPDNHDDNETIIVENAFYMGKRLKVITPTAGSESKLTENDFQSAASALGTGVSVAIIRAFSEVESGGKSGFGPNGLPIIAFEGHIFRKLTKKKFDKTYPLSSYKYLKKAGPEWQQNNKDQAVAWETLNQAMKLDCDAALQSCSWGMFQVMGFNFKSCGYKNVDDFVSAMKAGERGQLNAFVGYCKSKLGLTQALANRDFANMARLFNGDDFGNYDKLIEKHYKKNGGI